MINVSQGYAHGGSDNENCASEFLHLHFKIKKKQETREIRTVNEFLAYLCIALMN